MGVKGWRDLVKGKKSRHAALIAQAWPKYVQDYGLTAEEAEPGEMIPQHAAGEYMRAHRAGRVPAWVIEMALTAEIEQAAKGG